jgi:hypothetical protein
LNQKVIEKFLDNGVKNLQEFGYPSVTRENIMTDMIYGAFFKRMLNESKGSGFDKEIDYLLSQVKESDIK